MTNTNIKTLNDYVDGNSYLIKERNEQFKYQKELYDSGEINMMEMLFNRMDIELRFKAKQDALKDNTILKVAFSS